MHRRTGRRGKNSQVPLNRELAGGAVVLAAGGSRRFGSDKRHHALPGGGTMLEATLAAYQGVFDTVFLVLRPEDEAWATALAGVRPVYAPDSVLGMGHSLAAGVRAARRLDFLFVALADMPYIRTATLDRLQRAMTAAEAIVQPIHRGTPGHPVGFGSAYFDELQRLTGDTGAREVINAHQEKRTLIQVEDAGVLVDIDRPP